MSPSTTGPASVPRMPGLEMQAIEAHRLEFTGSGSEYFRVWIVNVLLSILTLGFYTPWARRRTAQYFYGHTLVADSPLEFTAQQRKMVMGFVLLMLITLAYQIALRTGQDTAVSLFLLAGAALAPYIWASAMRFRLGATRWRGLRLQFTASWREVYLASWPVFAMALIWIGVVYAIQALAPEAAAALEQLGEEAPGQRPRMPAIHPAMGGVVVLGLVLSVLCVIRLEYNYKSLLVQRGQVGAESGRWKPVYMDFVKIWAGTVGVFLLSLAVLALLLAAVFGGSAAVLGGLGKRAGLWIFLWIIAGAVLSVFLMFLASAPARAYREARMFQLTWNNIGVSRFARFKCRLRTQRFVALRLRNMVFTLLTLGLYRPFARAAEYRMKVESVTLHVKGGVDRVAGALTRQQQNGLGDALADAAGLDLIG